MDEDRIRRAFDAWRWTPPGAVRERTEQYEIAVTPGSYALTFVYGLDVPDPARLESVIDRFEARVRELGGTGARVTVTPWSRPPGLSRTLEERGYRTIEDAEGFLARLGGPGLRPTLPGRPAVAGVEVREALTDAEYEVHERLLLRIFEEPTPGPEVEERFRASFRARVRDRGHSDRYLAWEGASPVGVAGMELVPPAVRLFGTGVVPERRGRGIYGALVRARCAAAVARGAEFALVVARLGSSAPILTHYGFEPVGPFRVLEALWPPGPAPGAGRGG